MVQALSLACWLTSTSFGQDDSMQEEPESSPEDELAWAREAALGLERVYLNEAEWSFAPIVDTPGFRTTGSLTWRYDGQQVYSDAAVPEDKVVEYVEPDFVLTGIEFDPKSHLDLLTVDGYGRRWVVDSFDLDLMEEELAAAGVELGADLGEDGIAGVEFNPDAGLVHEMDLTGWTVTPCDGTDDRREHSSSGPIVENVTLLPEDSVSLKMFQGVRGPAR